jgi:hypothetical protein
LPALTSDADATATARACAQSIADTLKIARTRHTARDAVDYARRVVLDRVEERSSQAAAARRRAHAAVKAAAAGSKVLSSECGLAADDKFAQSALCSDADIDAMVFKVKEIYPSVPLLCIRHDIGL